MDINTKYFGSLSYTEEEVITFENGIFGFEENKHFLLIRFEKDNGGLLCLQNLEDEQLAFIVMNPFCFLSDYRPQFSEKDLEKLGSPDGEALLCYNICVLNDDVKKSSVNLRCPLVINGETRQALQVVLEDNRYAFKHPFHEFVKEK